MMTALPAGCFVPGQPQPCGQVLPLLPRVSVQVAEADPAVWPPGSSSREISCGC